MTGNAKKVILAVLILLTLIASFVYYNNYMDKLRSAAAVIKIEEAAGGKENEVISTQGKFTEPELTEPDKAEYQKMIKVHVAGAVNRPGLYEAPGDSRAGDLIDIAGGKCLRC